MESITEEYISKLQSLNETYQLQLILEQKQVQILQEYILKLEKKIEKYEKAN